MPLSKNAIPLNGLLWNVCQDSRLCPTFVIQSHPIGPHCLSTVDSRWKTESSLDHQRKSYLKTSLETSLSYSITCQRYGHEISSHTDPTGCNQEHWKSQLSRLEQTLSDTVHQRLTKRFIDELGYQQERSAPEGVYREGESLWCSTMGNWCFSITLIHPQHGHSDLDTTPFAP